MSNAFDILKKTPFAAFCLERLNYEVVADKNSRLYRVIRSPGGDIFISKQTPDKAHLAFSPDGWRGNIPDLLEREGFSRREIWANFCAPETKFIAPKVDYRPVVKKDAAVITSEIYKEYTQYLQRCVPGDNYLTLRGIGRATIGYFGLKVAPQEWFAPLYYMDQNDDFQAATAIRYVIFSDGQRKRYFLPGYEKRGSYSLLVPQNTELQACDTLLLFESPVDAVSYAQLRGPQKEAIYLSFCGSFSAPFENQLLRVIKKLAIRDVHICLDNDGAGRRFAARLCALLETVDTQTHFPFRKDWNDDLNKLKYNE